MFLRSVTLVLIKCNFRRSLPKAPTGIKGFDKITFGGLPKGRPTLVTGGAGSGKTLFGMEFLFRGPRIMRNRAYFSASKNLKNDLVSNFASLGFD
jgi:circadian clock protein KaiC